jgi:hypothetical protein
MERQTPPREPQLRADQRIWNLAYGQGYAEGCDDGRAAGEGAFRDWLLGALELLADDLRLRLRHDLETPMDVLAEIRALVEEGMPLDEAIMQSVSRGDEEDAHGDR